MGGKNIFKSAFKSVYIPVKKTARWFRQLKKPMKYFTVVLCAFVLFDLYLLWHFFMYGNTSPVKLEFTVDRTATELFALDSPAHKGLIKQADYASFKFSDGQLEKIMQSFDAYGSAALAVRVKFLPTSRQKKLFENELEKKKLLEQLKGRENITLDGQKINLYANIGDTKDLGLVLKNDAGGIGLFRSEFIYLGSDNYPTEDEQFAIYKKVAQTLAGKKVIIRTLDIGADKQADYFALPAEENPALGLRAIRICLTRPEVFRTQLRAILRASAYGKISIMFPMIISVDEVKKIKSIVENIKAELDSEGLNYDKNIELGIMIETPAAVMIADELAEEVDFFSVGTNDLTQYTLAIDRQNQSLDMFYDPHHPAIMKMLKMVVDAAHRHGAWAGICGELGADLSLTKEFLAMGYDELSVSPGRILSIRKTVLETNVEEYKKQKA